MLGIPEVWVDKIITLYHSSLFAGHQCVIKVYLTIGDKLFIPGLILYLCFYIKGCYICQLLHNEKPPTRQLQTRINLNYRSIYKLSMDLKVILQSNKGHKYILCITDEVTNYLITAPIFQSKSEYISDALLENVITKYCVPDCIIMDQDSTFRSSLMNDFLRKYCQNKDISTIQLPIVKAEHGIKSLTTIPTKHFTGLGQMWPKYLSLAMFMYNTFNTPNMTNLSPYELVFGRKSKLLLNLETKPDIKVSGIFKDYFDLLNKRLQYLHRLIQDLNVKD